MSIDALGIWKEFSEQEDNCKKALQFFKNAKKDTILQKGSVNFDDPSNPLPDEKPLYRVAYYCSTEGYMNMHIEQNRFALRKYLKKPDLSNQRILFVDFGCGPMTAGLVFAEIMDEYHIKRDSNLHYIGIDVSKNMCIFAKKINDKYKVFNSPKILPSDKFDVSHVCFSPDIAVLCFSYVLAQDTLKSGDEDIPKSLAHNWHGIFEKFKDCRKSIAIYQNPQGNFEENWRKFTAELKRIGSPDIDRIRYTEGDIEECPWSDRHSSSAMAMITGER